MHTVAIILAGGSGSRMGADVPKQFILVEGKPVLIYTLQGFQRHPMVDEIVLVCIDGWQDYVADFASRCGITKLSGIVPGGATGQESIRNAVYSLEGRLSPDDLVIIHDGIRPLVETGVLSSVIATARRHGNAVASLPYNEQIFIRDDEFSTVRYIQRETLRRVSTPQAYRFDLLDRAYREAFEKGIGIHGSSYTNTMMADLGVRLYFAEGSDRNIKLTTQGDLDIFRSYVSLHKDEL